MGEIRMGETGCSHSAFRNRCRSRNIKSYVAVQDVLIFNQKQVRLLWCEEHRNEVFDNLVFNDEMVIQLRRSSSGKIIVYRQRSESLRLNCIYDIPHVMIPGYLFYGVASRVVGSGV